LQKAAADTRIATQNAVCYKFDEASMAATTTRADKILVVDDDARIRDLLRRYLTQQDFEVLLAEDGKSDAAGDAT
jgi:PleD family two-component response regulator